MKQKKYIVQTAEQWYSDEIKIYAQFLAEGMNHDSIRQHFITQNIFNDTREASAVRRFGRVVRRAKALGDEGLILLNRSMLDDQLALVLMSYLEVYRFAYEFVFEFASLRLQNIERTVYLSEFDQFYHHKYIQHPDLNWTDDSQRRMRTQIFSMLTKGRLLEKKSKNVYEIQKLFLSEDVTRFFIARPPYDGIVM